MNRFTLSSSLRPVARLLCITLMLSVPFTASASGDYSDDHPDLKAALKQALDLDDTQLRQRINAERLAAEQNELLVDALGGEFAGSWFDPDSLQLVVGVTGNAAADTVASVGARSVLLKHSLATLERAHQQLNLAFGDAYSQGIVAWFIDVKSNRIVVQTIDLDARRAADALTASGVDPELVELQAIAAAPVALSTQLYGGSAYYKGGSAPQCSVGFAVKGGFLTAGHCGSVGQIVSLPSIGTFGQFSNSVYPGSDMASVAITVSGVVVNGSVDTLGGGLIPVVGSTPSPIGATVCRSGFSTGYQCGVVTALNATVNYGQGAVYGLTKTTACAWFGDSGGPFISSNGHAQGMASGGTVSLCENYFQPVQPALTAFATELKIGTGSAPPTTAPSISQFRCPDSSMSGNGQYVCHLNRTGSGPTGTAWFVDGWFYGPNFIGDMMNGQCSTGVFVTARARVANSQGSATDQRTFLCPSNPRH